MDVFKTLILDTPTVEGATGTVTSVDLTAGTGISVSGGPITSSGSITVTNTSPDQTVALTGGTGISTSGTYPNFTITNDAPDQTVSIASGTGISVTGSYPSFTVTNSSPSLGGDVVGPASATDNAVVRFDSTTGKLIQDSGVSISDANLLTTTALTVNDNTTLGSSNTDTVNFNARVASDINPATDNTYDLGVTGHEWRNLNIDGTANIDSLVADTADINGGTIDGTTVGSTTPSTIAGTTGTFNSTLSVAGIITATQGVIIGDDSSYLYDSGTGALTLRLGASGPYLSYLIDSGETMLDGASGALAFGTSGVRRATITSTGLNSTAIGATTPSTVAATTITGSGNLTITGGTAHSIEVGTGKFILSRTGIASTDFDFASGRLNVTTTQGLINLRDVATDATNKSVRIGNAHYTNSEEPLALISSQSTNTTGVVSIGGGTSSFNAATGVSVYAAANNTTVLGTKVAGFTTTKLEILPTTASTSTTTGALTVAGGVGVAGAAYIGGGLAVTGALSSTGILSGPGFSARKTTATSGLVKIQDEGANVYNVIGSRNNADSAALPLNFQATNFAFNGAVAVTGAITATGNITAYYSDDRLKTKLGNIENALDKVSKLNGFYYEANETAQALGYKPVREVGLSAQQVEAVLPEVVAPAPIDNEYKTLHYERVIPLLVEAIKELKAEIELLKK